MINKFNKINNILLCYVGTESVKSAVNEPLGIEAIASSIRNSRPEIKVILFNEQIHGERKLIETLVDIKPEIVGFSIPNGSFERFLEIEKKINTVFSEEERPVIVIGGTIPSFHAEIALEATPNSLVLKGEGETAIIELIDAISGRIDFSEVKNLVYYENGILYSNTQEVPEIETINIPVRDLVKESVEHGGYAFMETSRGCSWGHCTFCLRPYKEKHRRFMLEKVIEDVKNLISNGVKKVYLTDEEFIGKDLDWLESFCDQLIEMNNQMKIMATCQTISIYKKNDLNNERKIYLLKKLKQAGLVKMFLGIESGSKKQLKRYGKSASAEENVEAIKILKNIGIELGVGFINFDPLMDMNDLEENIQFIEENEILFHLFSPFHAIDVREGCAYEKLLKREGLIGPLDPQTALYKYNFNDKKIQVIYDTCKNVFDRWVDFQVCLRQISNTSNFNGARDIYNNVRVYQFEFLKSIFRVIKNQDLSEVSFKNDINLVEENMKNSVEQLMKIIPSDRVYIRDSVIKSLPPF